MNNSKFGSQYQISPINPATLFDIFENLDHSLGSFYQDPFRRPKSPNFLCTRRESSNSPHAIGNHEVHYPVKKKHVNSTLRFNNQKKK